MKDIRKSVVLTVAAAVACAMLAVTVPSATAGEGPKSVASSRSFPKASDTRRDILAEATSTSVEEDSQWGKAEDLNVPKTKSQAEKDAEAAAQAAAEAQAQAQAAARRGVVASRSGSRTSLGTSAGSASTGGASAPVAAPDAAAAGSVTAFAVAIANNDAYGYGGCTPPTSMDCSCFVQYVFAQFGISLPRTSGAQATVGTAVPSLAQAQPGDIIANASHSAIYLGNGMMVDAGNYRVGIVVRPVSFMAGSPIRRVL